MNHDMMDGMGTGMMLGMDVFALVIVAVVVLSLAALIKYLFFSPRR